MFTRRDPNSKVSNILIRNIPRDLHLQYKAYCARRGLTMNRELIKHLKEVLKNEVHH